MCALLKRFVSSILDDNSLIGSLPTELGQLGSLQTIDLGMMFSNLLYAIFRFIFSYVLTCLFLHFSEGNNMLVGQIPSEFGTMASLQMIDVGEYV